MIRRNLLLPLCFAAMAAAYAAPAASAPKAETRAQYEKRMAWWKDARFGMFIHWGLYAIPAGEWNGQTDHGEWIMNTAHIPVEQYETFRTRFNPVKFDADAWAQMAKDAGMQYVVITSKHHDGFALFDSKAGPYNVMSTPFHRDIMKEMADACRRHGLRICWYHSIMDWHNPDYLPRRDWETRPAAGADFDRYVGYLRTQVTELLTNYGDIGLMWFDGQWEPTWNHTYGQSLYDLCRTLQPNVIVNNRVDVGGMPPGPDAWPGRMAGDYGTPEQTIPPTGLPGVYWETCMTMNDHWGYNSHDQNWKSTRELLRNLTDIASKGGNYLLNVGPTAEGLFPQPSVDRLAQIGRWMRANGEAIRGTDASPFPQLPWGRCTMKALPRGRTRLYLHVYDWPADGRLVVGPLLNTARGARLLADASRKVTARADGTDIVLTGLGAAPDADVSVIALDIQGVPKVPPAPEVRVGGDAVHGEWPFIGSTQITLTGAAEGAVLHVSTNGSEPTADSPVYAGPVSIAASTTLKARAFMGKRAVSPVSTVSFRRDVPLPPVQAAAAAPGLSYAYAEATHERVPETFTPTSAGTTPRVGLDVPHRKEYYVLEFTGLVSVPEDGMVTFATESDDGSRLFIDGRLVADNDGPHTMERAAGRIALAAGKHRIRVVYSQLSGDSGLRALWAPRGGALEPIPDAAFSHEDH